MSERTCAVITLDEAGGGVAAVARLVWDAFQARWARDARLVTLLPRSGTSSSIPDLSARVSFGSKLAATQALGGSEWILYTHLALAQVQGYIPSALQVPYAVFLHGIEVWRPLTDRQRAALEGARVLIANSAFTARRASAMHPWLGPVAVCELALPSQPGAEVDLQMPSPGEPSVLIVGRMAASERYKGHDQLIDAWPAVRRACPDARLVIAGDGDDRPRLQAKAAALIEAGAVEFTGFVSAVRLHELYRAASVFAMPSRNEGFGLVYLEAMRHGVPCVGATQDAAGEVIEAGVTGLLVDQDDVPSLVRHVIRLITDEELRVSMGRAGQARLRQRFSREQFESRLMSLLDDAFGESAGRESAGGSAAARRRLAAR